MGHALRQMFEAPLKLDFRLRYGRKSQRELRVLMRTARELIEERRKERAMGRHRGRSGVPYPSEA